MTPTSNPDITLDLARCILIQQAFPAKPLDTLLKPDYQLVRESERFNASYQLDSYDSALKQAGKLLLRAGPYLLLCTSPTIRITRQPGRSLDTKKDIRSKELNQHIRELDNERKLIRHALGRCRIHQMAMLDDEGKTCVRLTVLEVKSVHGWLSLIALDPLRGYEPEAEHLSASIVRCCKRPSNDFELFLSRLDLSPTPSAKTLSLQPKASIKDSCSMLLTHCFGSARSVEQGIIQDVDIECLHQYRVQLRKVRSLLTLCKGVYSDDAASAVSERFADLMKPTGRVRDLDVMLLLEDKFIEQLPPMHHEGLRLIFSRLKRQRQREWKALAESLSQQTYRRKADALQKLLDHPDKLTSGDAANQTTREYADALLAKRYRKTRELAHSITSATPDAEVHRLRIQCKKLRYLLDTFLSLLRKQEAKICIKQLKALQDLLGDFNDCTVQQEHLGHFLEQCRRRSSTPAELLEAGGAMIALIYQQQLLVREAAIEQLKQFCSTETEQRFLSLLNQETLS